MGSLCNFRPMRQPHSLKLSTIHTNKQVLHPFNLPNITARFTRTRNQTPCLVLAQKNNYSGNNPEKRQLGSSDKSLNAGSNGILPKQERVAQRKRGNKYQKPSVLRESLSVVLQIWELFVSMCIYILQTMKSSVKIEFNRQNLKDIGLGFLCVLGKIIFLFPYYLCWDIFWFVLINGLKISAVVGIIGYGYVWLF